MGKIALQKDMAPRCKQEMLSSRKASGLKSLQRKRRDDIYHRLYEDAPLGYITLNRRGIIIEVNLTATRLLGEEQGFLIGKAFSRFVTPQCKSLYRRHSRALYQKGQKQNCKLDLLRADGVIFSVQMEGIPVSDREGVVDKCHICIIDITHIKLMEDNLRQERELEQKELLAQVEDLAYRLSRGRDILRAVMENTGAMLVYLDPDFNFVLANTAYARGCGYEVAYLIGKNHFTLFPNSENQAIFEKARDTGQPVEFRDKPFEFPEHPERGVTYWDWTLVPVKNAAGKLQGLVFSLIETTRRKRAEIALEKARDELESRVVERTVELARVIDKLHGEVKERREAEEELRALSHRMVRVQEEERRAVARELHDVLGQSLTVLKLVLDKAQHSFQEELPAVLDEAQTVTDEVALRVRGLSLDLRPSMLDDLGLLPALLWYFERFTKQTRIKIKFKHSGLGNNFPLEINTAAYRIIQEALTNIARYAKVDELVVNVLSNNSMLVVRIEDKGVGFISSALPLGKSSGLRGMVERATLLGGKVTIESHPGTGTVVNAELPLPVKPRISSSNP